MVAYSFKSAFVGPIQTLVKRQTIRLPRPRHARPGEDIQLYVGMRTRHCRKIIPDPCCVGVDHLVLDLRPRRLVHVEINGVVLDLASEEADRFAIADGFGCPPKMLRPIEFLGVWWCATHAAELFEDLVIIRWQPRQAAASVAS